MTPREWIFKYGHLGVYLGRCGRAILFMGWNDTDELTLMWPHLPTMAKIKRVERV
jgi:hypothetical protein